MDGSSFVALHQGKLAAVLIRPGYEMGRSVGPSACRQLKAPTACLPHTAGAATAVAATATPSVGY